MQMTPLASRKHKKRAALAAAMGRKNKKGKTAEVKAVALTEPSDTAIDNININVTKKKNNNLPLTDRVNLSREMNGLERGP